MGFVARRDKCKKPNVNYCKTEKDKQEKLFLAKNNRISEIVTLSCCGKCYNQRNTDSCKSRFEKQFLHNAYESGMSVCETELSHKQLHTLLVEQAQTIATTTKKELFPLSQQHTPQWNEQAYTNFVETHKIDIDRLSFEVGGVTQDQKYVYSSGVAQDGSEHWNQLQGYYLDIRINFKRHLTDTGKESLKQEFETKGIIMSASNCNDEIFWDKLKDQLRNNAANKKIDPSHRWFKHFVGKKEFSSTRGRRSDMLKSAYVIGKLHKLHIRICSNTDSMEQMFYGNRVNAQNMIIGLHSYLEHEIFNYRIRCRIRKLLVFSHSCRSA